MGGIASWNDSNHKEIKIRLECMCTGWAQLGKTWTMRLPFSLVRSLFISKVIEAGMSGVEAYVFLLESEYLKLDTRAVLFLRVLEKRKSMLLFATVTMLQNLNTN